MIEFDKSEYLQSKVEDSELIAVLCLYEELSAIEAISIKDLLLYKGDENDRLSRTTPSDPRVGPLMGISDSHYTSVHQDQGWAAQTKAK